MDEVITRVTLIGQIAGGSGLGAASGGAHCKWRIVSDAKWQHVRGPTNGSSQTAKPSSSGGVVWAHAIDCCFDAKNPNSLTWPHIEVEIYDLNSFDGSAPCGYAVVSVPPSAGQHDISVPAWRPRRGLIERITAAVCGVGGAALKAPQLLMYGISEPLSRAEEQGSAKASGVSLARGVGMQRLNTEPAGAVHLVLGVCVQRRYADANDEEVVAQNDEEETD